MSNPDDIPQDVWQQARAAFVAYSKIEDARALLAVANGEYDGYPMISLAARAIMSAEKRGEEREREACAALAKQVAKGRDRQSEEAKASKSPRSGSISRDFQSMAISASDVEDAIRKRGEG